MSDLGVLVVAVLGVGLALIQFGVLGADMFEEEEEEWKL